MHPSPHRPAPVLLPVLLALVTAACGASPSPSGSAVPGSPAATLAPSPSSGTASPEAGRLPVVIDTDMGQDDLLAIYALLREPAVDVRAITVTGTGLAHCGPGTRNLRQVLGAFDRLDIPFGCGRREPGPNGRLFPEEWRNGTDAMYGVVLPAVAGTELPGDAVTVLRDALAASAAPATVVALGPWTNLADLAAAEPGSIDRIGRVHAMGGALDVPGNVELGATTPEHGVEWNLGADPDALAAVLALDVPVTFVPLDATNDVPVPADMLTRLEGDHTAAGADIAFETYARSPFLAGEGQFLWDALAAVTLVDPSLAAWEDTTIAVTVAGPEAGRIRRDAAGRPVRVATAADRDRSVDALLTALRRGEPRPEPFTLGGTLRVAWDGTTCDAAQVPERAGPVLVVVENRSDTWAGVLTAGVLAPRTWDDAIALVQGLDLSQPVELPDWLVPAEGPNAEAGPGATTTTVLTLRGPVAGVVCAAGEWPDLAFHDGGSFQLTE